MFLQFLSHPHSLELFSFSTHTLDSVSSFQAFKSLTQVTIKPFSNFFFSLNFLPLFKQNKKNFHIFLFLLACVNFTLKKNFTVIQYRKEINNSQLVTVEQKKITNIYTIQHLLEYSLFYFRNKNSKLFFPFIFHFDNLTIDLLVKIPCSHPRKLKGGNEHDPGILT